MSERTDMQASIVPRETAIAAWNKRAEQAKPSASCEADEATVERVARLLFVRDEGHPVSEATLNYWFSCDENSSGEDAYCKRHCDELREDAHKIITALRANAPEQAGEGMAEKINAASFAQLWVNYGDVKAERDELREALTRADACLRRPGAADHRVIQALAYTALSSGAGDEG